ncbi:hypothetical protein I4U23_010395 [Adineta vaga]|nr:hypothetical protein I4U23_010395 [Adineta vaga]
MLFDRVILVFLLYLIPFASTLQCTINCSFKSELNSLFEIPNSCNETSLSKLCTFRMSYWYHKYYSYLSFDFDRSNSSSVKYYSTSIRLADDGSIGFDYTISHQCDQTDDCAMKFAKTNIPNLLRRLNFNYTDLRDELWPLLVSKTSIDDVDLSCFDSKANIRQCALVKKPGLCQATQQLRGRKRMDRSCNQQLFSNEKTVSMFDFGSFANLELKCNRSLCNGPMTFDTVKEILFKYNITKTIDGQLNQGIRCYSLSFLVFVLISIHLL